MILLMQCFNSTLVRLKRDTHMGGCRSLHPFQFHTGAIKTIFGNVRWEGNTKFQFHTGAIKTSNALSKLSIANGFNSTLVRLKHKVVIDPHHSLLSFNSTLVRLKLESH